MFRLICILNFALLSVEALPYFKDDPPPVPPGGKKIVNSSDPLVIGAAETAVEDVNQAIGYSDTNLRYSLIRIENGTQQVVDGEIYTLQIAVGPSQCQNILSNIGKTEKDCPPLEPYWLEQKTKRATLDVDSIEARHAADIVVNEFNRIRGYSCCEYRESVAEILSAKSEMSQYGYVYDLVIKLGTSFCTNTVYNKARPSIDCTVQPGSDLRTCSVQVALTKDDQHLQAVVHHHCDHPNTTNAPSFGKKR